MALRLIVAGKDTALCVRIRLFVRVVAPMFMDVKNGVYYF